MIWLLLAQHCGGPCEVPRGAEPVSASPRYALVAGKDKGNWRYLWNYVWTEDGAPKFEVEKTLRPLEFGYRRMFVSPTGNGFLVTGNPYVKSKAPPFFVFCSPQGDRLLEATLEQAFTEEERTPGPCPNCDCKDVLYIFGEEPQLSANGCWVETVAAKTRRRVSFFLPLGAPVKDREAFERTVAQIEWKKAADADGEREQIDAAIRRLDDDDAAERDRAGEALAAKGLLALEAVRKARASGSKEVQVRAALIEGKLKPRENDLDVMRTLLSYSEEDVVRGVKTRLAQVLPAEAKGREPGPWIDEHRDRLSWDSEARAFRLK